MADENEDAGWTPPELAQQQAEWTPPELAGQQQAEWTPPELAKPPEEGPLTTFAREAARSVATLPPTIAGGALGGAALSTFGPIGTIGGTLGGAVAGSIAGNKFIDWVLNQLGVREGTGFLSKQAEQAGQEANPKSALLGSLAAAPVGFGAKLPAAMSAGEKLLTRGIGAAGMGGLDIGQQLVEKGDVDLSEALASFVAGGLWSNPRPLTKRFSAVGERVGRPLGDMLKREPTAGAPRDTATGMGEATPMPDQSGIQMPDQSGQPLVEAPKKAWEGEHNQAVDSVEQNVAREQAQAKTPAVDAEETTPEARPDKGNPQSAPVAGEDASPSADPGSKGRKYTPQRILDERQANKESVITGLVPQEVIDAFRANEKNSMPAEGAKPSITPAEQPRPNAPVFTPEQQAAAKPTPGEKIYAPEPVTHPASIRALERIRARQAGAGHDPATLEKLVDQILARGEEAGHIPPDSKEAARERIKEIISKPPQDAEMLAERDRLIAENERLTKAQEPVTAAVKSEPLPFVQKTLKALEARGHPQAIALADGIRNLPHDQQVAAASKAAAMMASRTGKVPTQELKNQRFRNPETVPTITVGGKEVSFKSKSAAARATQALQAMDTAMKEHPPVEGETASQLQDRMRKVIEQARVLNKGELPTKSYRPNEKPAEWLFARHAEKIANRKGLLREGFDAHTQAIADEKLIRGSPEDVEAYRANRRGEADIAKSRRSGEEAIAGAEAEKAAKGEVSDTSNHTPEAQAALHDEVRKVSDNIVKYADTKYSQFEPEERSVATGKDVAEFRKGQEQKPSKVQKEVEAHISKPTLSLIKKVVEHKDMPKIEPPVDPDTKYPGSCT